MSSRLNRIRDWVEEARKANYRASELARAVCVSDRHLRRYFLKLFGLSPQRWIDRLRLRESKKLLAVCDSVKAVAYKLGYKQVSHFCKVFKCHFGTTPADSLNAPRSICPQQITNVRERLSNELEMKQRKQSEWT